MSLCILQAIMTPRKSHLAQWTTRSSSSRLPAMLIRQRKDRFYRD